MRNTRILKAIIPILVFAAFSVAVYAGGYTQLPRNFGPFEIGIKQNEFYKISGITPEPCAICIKNETFATLEENQLKRFNLEGDGADFFFYNDILYHIAIGPKVKDLFTAQQDYEERFGGPGIPIKTKGIGIIKWEDPGTIITLNYHEQEKEVYSINIYDWNIKEERDWRESIAPEQAPASANLE